MKGHHETTGVDVRGRQDYTTARVPTIFIVEDNASLVFGLQQCMESAGLAAEVYLTGEDFLSAPHADRPGCVLVNFSLACMDGLELQEQLAREESLLPVVFIGGCDNISLAVQAVKRGAFEFLAVPLDDQHVLECVGNAIREDARRRRRQATRMEAAARLGRLTAREREVFELVVLGRTNKEIGSRLHISTKTVVAHRAKVMLKTEADNLVELLRLADLGLDASWITHRQF